MNSKWIVLALLFSVAVNIAVVGTLVYFWPRNEERRIVFRNRPPKQHEIVWFRTPHVPPKVAQDIDSLRRDYHEQLVTVRMAIDADREAIIAHLMQNKVDRDSLEKILQSLTHKQITAERLTIDHLLEIKPLLPQEEWTFFIRDLKPRQTIRTKILKLNSGDSTSILMQEEIEDIQIFDQKTKNHKSLIKRKIQN
ncbi:periplasmic heavy metal sensor [candidate division KSB1 bacterium]|nr:periplasmic heavy metal sensor [candidate division KSB1 bacterium]